jgi:hypothetical protein
MLVRRHFSSGPFDEWRETKESFKTLPAAFDGVKDMIKGLRKQVIGGEEERQITVKLDMVSKAMREGDQ